MEVLQQEIVKLLAKGAMTAGEIGNRLNGQPAGWDVSQDDAGENWPRPHARRIVVFEGSLVRTN